MCLIFWGPWTYLYVHACSEDSVTACAYLHWEAVQFSSCPCITLSLTAIRSGKWSRVVCVYISATSSRSLLLHMRTEQFPSLKDQMHFWLEIPGMIAGLRTNRECSNCTSYFFGYWHQSCYVPCNKLLCIHVFLCHKQVMRDAKDGITSLAVTDHEIVTGSVDCKVRRYDIRANRLFSDFIGGINALKMYVNSINIFVWSQHLSVSHTFSHTHIHV